MPFISIIVPLKDEKSTIEPLVAQIHEGLKEIGCTYEIVLIDDGSEDGTSDIVRSIAQGDPKVAAILFRKNCGQTAALSAGFDFSTGDVIIPMDGDLQNDPADIPRLLEKLSEGYDVVSGWRKNRQDNKLTRILPSKIANKVISIISGVKLHDYGCTLKAYRREVVKDVRLYGEMHRFIPVYAVWQGGRTAELAVNHRPREHGKSKYGIGRTFKVVLDLMVVKFLTDYLHKPIYVFGGLGILSILSGLAPRFNRL